jgi:hypothetical protein
MDYSARWLKRGYPPLGKLAVNPVFKENLLKLQEWIQIGAF